MMLPIASWMPDQPALTGGTVQCSGVLPVSSSAFGPLPGPVPFVSSGTIPGGVPFQATEVFRQDGTHIIVCAAGFALTQLYALNATLPGQVWHAFSPVVQSFGSPITGSSVRFAQFKNTLLIAGGGAANGAGFFVQDLGNILSAGQPALIAGAPSAAFVCVAKNFAIVGKTYDPVNGALPYRIWWSAFNDPTTWPTPGSTQAITLQSDYNDFDGASGIITGICGAVMNADLLIFFEFGIWSGSYAGAPNIFNFYKVASGRGTTYSDSIVLVEGVAYFLGENGFYSCDGINTVPIGIDQVDRWVLANWATDVQAAGGGYDSRAIYGGYDPQSRCIFWVFTASIVFAGQTVPGGIVFYHREHQRWSCYPIDPGVVAIGFTGGFLPAAGGAVTDTMRVFCTIDHAGNASHWTGPPVAAAVCTTEMEPIPGGLAFCDGAKVIGDAGLSCSLAVATRNRLDLPQVFGPDVTADITGDFPQRTDARFMQALIKVPAGARWTLLQGVEPSVSQSGGR